MVGCYCARPCVPLPPRCPLVALRSPPAPLLPSISYSYVSYNLSRHWRQASLHVSGGSVVTTCDSLKVLVAAAAAGQLDRVAVVPADSGRIPFGRPVALEVGGKFLFSANEAARFLARQAGSKTLSATSAGSGDPFAATTLPTDEWLGWEERVLQPLVPVLVSGLQQGALVAAAAGAGAQTAGAGGFATAAATALASFEAALGHLGAALGSSPFLAGKVMAGAVRLMSVACADWVSAGASGRAVPLV